MRNRPTPIRLRRPTLAIAGAALLIGLSCALGIRRPPQLLGEPFQPGAFQLAAESSGLDFPEQGDNTSTQDRGKEKAQPGCSTTACHSEYLPKQYMAKNKFPHAPAKMRLCTKCHEARKNSTPYKAGGTHRFQMKARDGALCLKCHESQTDSSHVHTPLTKNKCVACHSPHGSNYPALMRKKRMADTCFACHDEQIATQDKVHAPVAMGQCTVCHDPHSSPNKDQLTRKGSDLCFSCHSEMEEEIKSRSVIHKPVLEDCAKCHSPHGSKYDFFLKKKVEDLCLSCHEDIKKAAKEQKVRHGALDSKRSCLQCHDPHASDQARMLRAEPKKVCLSCHDKVLVSKGRRIRNMKKFLEENKDQHGPVKEGDCGACHNAHGSPFMNILRKAYPKKFYSAFEESTYALCFSCHEESLVLDAETETLTGFRNGKKNLHFVHVNRKKKGRSCRACHDVHASKQPKHIVDSVPFGKNWSYELVYTETEDGGRCGPACHVARSYERTGKQHPLENK